MNDPRTTPLQGTKLQGTALDISVLVPTFGRGEKLRNLLALLDSQTLAPERFEVIVVDDGSPEPVEVDAGARPFALKLIRQPNGGPASARNTGLEHCRAPLVLILNDDCVPAPDLLERHLAAHAELGGSCAVLGTFHFTEASRRSPFVRLLDESDLLFTFSPLKHGQSYDWGFFWTCNLSLSTEAIRAVGGFDAERFPEAIVEDVELGYRLGQRGMRVVYREDCRAEHDHFLTLESYLKRGVSLGRNLYRMWCKHGDPVILWRRTPLEVQAAMDFSVSFVEAYRGPQESLIPALQRLERDYANAPIPAKLQESTTKLIREIALGAFHRGLHLEHTGIDAVELMERGAPTGGLTSVVIASFDALALTKRCIESLRAAATTSHPIEIHVVDNGSTDGSAEWLEAQPDVHLIRNPSNHGAPRARNQAIPHCKGEWIAFLDNDIFVPPGWLERALYHGAVDPGVGAIPLVANRASKMQIAPYDGPSDDASIARAAEARYAEFERMGKDCEMFTSLAVLVKREVIERIGGFDEKFSPWGFEDDDLSLRILFAGWRNRVALDTFVFHAPYPDVQKHRRHLQFLDDNWRQFAAKWGPGGVTPKMFDFEALDLNSDRARALEVHVPLPGPDAPPPTWRHEPALESPVVAAAPAVKRERSAAARNVIVLGSGRSGTSLLAGTLAEAGWFVGDHPYPGREANPKGFYETAEINGINELLLTQVLQGDAALGRMARWLATAEGELQFRVPEPISARMRRLAERRPFVFKDPRFCYTLPAWREALGDARFVCVFRDPAVTARSILRECAEADYLRGVEMNFDRAIETWCAMYEAVLERHRHAGEWLFMHYDEVLTESGLDRLEAFVGAPVARDFPDAKLSRSRSERTVNERAARIYDELCALAGHANERGAPALAPAPPAELAAPELSVILCTYNRLETLKRCIASFESQSAQGRFELIVVNDGSADGTKEWLDAWTPRVPTRIVHRENGGLAAARNSAFEVARGRHYLLINDDTIAFPDLVHEHLAAHARYGPGVAIMGSFEQPSHEMDNALTRVIEDATLVFCFSQLKPGERHDWNAFWTCNVSVEAKHVAAIDGFDESFRRYGCEDTDLAYRLWRDRKVEVVYEPRARAHHEHVLDFDDLARRNRTVGRAWVRFFRKHPETLEHEYWREFATRTREQIDEELVGTLPERAVTEASARELARIDLGALERSGAAGEAMAQNIASLLLSQLEALNKQWWREGQLEGLEEFGARSFPELCLGRKAVAPAGGLLSPSGHGAAHAERPGHREPAASSAQVNEPWPLRSRGAERYLAWPRYDRSADLEALLETWADALIDHPERCLCLRHDPAIDGDLEAAIERLQEVYARVIGNDHELEVLFVDGAMAEVDLPRLGRAVRGVIPPIAEDPAREGWVERLHAQPVRHPAELG